MNQNKISEAVKVAICICAEDGLVSESEEAMVYQLISEKFPDYSKDAFIKAVDDFFSSKLQIEDYLAAITDREMQKFTLELSKVSAGIDGLDFRENVAIEKASMYWKLRHE